MGAQLLLERGARGGGGHRAGLVLRNFADGIDAELRVHGSGAKPRLAYIPQGFRAVEEMSRLKTSGLKVSAWIAVFIVAVVYLQRWHRTAPPCKAPGIFFWHLGDSCALFRADLGGEHHPADALPSSVYSLLAGSLLGFKAGYLTIILSNLVFCSAAFFIARRWGRGP